MKRVLFLVLMLPGALAVHAKGEIISDLRDQSAFQSLVKEIRAKIGAIEDPAFDKAQVAYDFWAAKLADPGLAKSLTLRDVSNELKFYSDAVTVYNHNERYKLTPSQANRLLGIFQKAAGYSGPVGDAIWPK